MLVRGAIAGFALIGLTAAASAQETSNALEQKVTACRAVDRDKARLKCFDDALNSVLGVDTALEERRQERKSADFGKPDDGESAVEELSATIAEARYDPNTGQTAIRLDNGQVWLTTSTGSIRRGFDQGRAITIRPGTIGGYRLTIDGKPGFAGVKRIR